MGDALNTGTIHTANLIDQLCDEFERGWVGKSPARIEDLVPAHAESLRRALFRELLAVEREYRAKDQRPITLDEARERFAQLGPWTESVVEELLAAPAAWEENRTPGPVSAILVPAADDLLPAMVGKFRVVRKLGGGGMGIVYLADDPDGRRQVAVKVMRPKYAADRSARERFLREARSAMTIEHDHVVPVYQVEENAGRPFLVMPVLKGESLEDRLTRDPRPPIELVMKVGLEVALGLAAAHAKGLVHRDVKPGNTWLDGDPSAPDPGVQVRRVKVLDFGLVWTADRTEGSMALPVAGTPQYMAPEQVAGRPADGRTDLFSLGAVLYRMAAGRPAFTGPTTTALLAAIATHHPPSLAQVNPSVPPTLSALIDRLLAKDPEQRPGSAAEVANALAAIGRGQPVPSPAACVRRPRPLVLAAVVLLLSIGVGIWAVTRPQANLSEPLPDPPSAHAGSARVTGLPSSTTPVGYRSRVDLLVERNNQLVRLNKAGALPLKENDGYVVEGNVDPPAYLYMVWVDPNHEVIPLYPWDPTGGPQKLDPWQTRPARESPVPAVRIPEPGRVYCAPDARPGVATIVLFARRTPLDVPHEVVRGWFANLPELELAPEDEGTAVWFDNFRKVTDDDRRGTFGVKEQKDPFAAWQGQLFRALGDHATYQSAVSFARTGNTKGK